MLYSPGLEATANGPRTRRAAKQPKRCSECGQCFSKTEHLARHIRSHTKEKPFSCRECGRSYSRQDSLLRHSRAHSHTNARNQRAGSPKTVSPLSSPQYSLTGESSQIGLTPRGDLIPRSGHDTGTRNSLSSAASSHPSTTSATSGWGTQSEPTSALSDGALNPPVLHLDVSPSTDQYVGTAFPGLPASIFHSPTDLELMDIGLNAHEPGWLLGSDFDLNALDFSISSAIPEWPHPANEDVSIHQESYDGTNTLGRSKGHMPLCDLVPAVQYHWYTTLTRDVCYESPDHLRGQDQIDEAYREGLKHKLQPCPSNAALPSADFLNLCIKLYFVRFNPVFPVVHAPSFRPSSENALLLLSVCSVGALFMGSPAAAAQGRKIFQTLNKANLSSWDTYIRRDAREWRSLVQASIIGQTFGMLSGQPDNVCMTESFHGTAIAWARQGGFFKIKQAPLPSINEPEASKEDIWRRWIDAEESVRLVLALYVHDSEFATTFHHEPLLRHHPDKLPVCNSDELFFAPTAADWFRLAEKHRSLGSEVAQVRPASSLAVTPPVFTARRPQMFAYASLAGIVASIQEKRSSFLDDSSKQYFRNLLLSWHNEYYTHIQGPKKHHINLLIFWHAAFMALYADSDLLERSIGRDGRLVAQEARKDIDSWAASASARRGVLHALLILKHLEMLPIGLEPAIHVPKAAFYSAMVVYSYIKFKSSVDPYAPSQDEVNIPELQVSGSTGTLNLSSDKTSTAIFSPVEPSILCNAIDLLRRIGHWEISRKFASILQILLDDLTKA